MTTLAITGATGAVGGAVARHLSDSGLPLRLIVRDPARAPELPNTEVRAASYGDRAASLAALDGVDVLFFVSAAESETRVADQNAFVQAAADAGVQHIVYTSFDGAAPDATFTLGRDHWATEEAIRNSGTNYTLLRDNFYLDVFEEFADKNGVIRGPAGEGRVAAVARQDVAAVAAKVLENPSEHRDQTYVLTGPEALTLNEAADILTHELGRTFSFHDETIPEARASRASYNAPEWELQAWISTYTAIADGSVATVTDDVERVLGRAPLSLADVLRQER